MELNSLDKENSDAFVKQQLKVSKQSVLKSIPISQDSNKKNVMRRDHPAGLKHTSKDLSLKSNIIPLKTSLGTQKYKLQFPTGPMGLILEPVVSSYGSMERHIGGKVKGYRFGDMHSDLFREVVQSSVCIGDIVFAINDREVDWMPFGDIMSMLEPLAQQSKALTFKCLSSDCPLSMGKSNKRRSHRKKTPSPSPSPAPSTPDASPTKIFRQFIHSDTDSPFSVKSLSPDESYSAAARHRRLDMTDRSFAGKLDDLKCDMASEAADRDAWRSRALMAEEALVELRSELVAAATSQNNYCAQLESELTVEQNSIKALVETLETERSERAAEQMELSGELNRMKEEQRDLREDMRAALRNATAEYMGMEAERDKAIAELEAMRDTIESEKMSLEKERQRMRESLSSVQRGHIDKLISFENDLSQVKHELATTTGQLERTTSLYHEELSKNRDLQASCDASCAETQQMKSALLRVESEVRSLKQELEHSRQDVEDKEEDTAHWKAVAEKLRQEIASHTKRNDSLSQDIVSKEKEIAVLRRNLSATEEQCTEKDAALATLQQHYDTLEASTSQTIEKNNALMQRIRNRATAHETELLQALSAAEAEHGSQISEYELKLSMASKEAEKAKNSEAALRKELDMERRKFSEMLDRQEEQGVANQEECVKLKKSLAVIQNKFDEASKSLNMSTARASELKTENMTLSEKLSETMSTYNEEVAKAIKLEQTIIKMGDSTDTLKAAHAATLQELHEMTIQLKQSEDEKSSILEELDEAKNTYVELRQRVEDYESSLADMRQLMASSDHISRDKSDTIELLQVLVICSVAVCNVMQNELTIAQEQLVTVKSECQRYKDKVRQLSQGIHVIERLRKELASNVNTMRATANLSFTDMRY